jgi:hypothetical protein
LLTCEVVDTMLMARRLRDQRHCSVSEPTRCNGVSDVVTENSYNGPIMKQSLSACHMELVTCGVLRMCDVSSKGVSTHWSLTDWPCSTVST